jgi:hypothetical protein
MVQAKKAYDAHMEDIAELERELAEVDKKRQDYEDTIAGESQQQGRPPLELISCSLLTKLTLQARS